METTVRVPKAFSVRDDHEFFTFQHLMGRLNPKLHVSQVGQGLHAAGGCTVFWGLVYLEGEPLTKADLDAALRDAGFDFTRSPSKIDYSCCKSK